MIEDRREAGRRLSEIIEEIEIKDPIVLSIPRGGVIVGDEIAKKLGCSLDVVISKKITPPDNPEYAIGAITEDGTIYEGQYWDLYKGEALQREIEEKRMEVNRRLKFYRGNSKYQLEGKGAIIVDDGIATGATVLAILKWIKDKNPKKIILAVPLMPKVFYEKIKDDVDKVCVLETPENFYSVGQFYKKFDQVSDDEVINILNSYKKTLFNLGLIF